MLEPQVTALVPSGPVQCPLRDALRQIKTYIGMDRRGLQALAVQSLDAMLTDLDTLFAVRGVGLDTTWADPKAGRGGWVPADTARVEDGDTTDPTVLRRHDVVMFGAPQHSYAIRVKLEGDPEMQVAVDDPEDRLSGMYQMDRPFDRYATVKIDGYEGDWVIINYPSCS